MIKPPNYELQTTLHFPTSLPSYGFTVIHSVVVVEQPVAVSVSVTFT